ncbi:MAG: Deoxyribodipyrimidine photolyase [uncultured Thermomicrobiales bacterium]|uniref:Deoxyribodipyrimidine photo-lyase n=1 Tax=uncultured Thermomicrobiales bacterium TaxID=1645740 RepID=A0A6J4VT87_9BACT|nr:MAG: Deoxyribodipyrimidine photolyase [uncultured Thermomicrobiales bacterium]
MSGETSIDRRPGGDRTADVRSYRTAIVWFRRDLRLHDHPALVTAVREAERVIPLYLFDDALLDGKWPAPNRLWFMRESVRLLDEALRARGGGMAFRRGRAADVLPAFAAEVGADAVYVTRDYGPYARGRDRAVAEGLEARGIRFHAKRGLLVHEPEEFLTDGGQPYAVFGPYRRRWEHLSRRPELDAPARLSSLEGIEKGRLPSLAELGAEGPTARGILEPGEPAARARLERWVAEGLESYADTRDQLGRDGSSRLSQDLHWGLLSPVEVVERCAGGGEGRKVYQSELAWRDFYTMVLFHNPRVTREPFHPQFKGLPFNDDPAHLAAWREGRTGYPVVDAAMRQLVALGWMHNRARMIVASFLSKHLLANYQIGEQYFMDHLVCGDLALNNGNWQWASSTGTDPQPYFRIFNPTLQGKRYDPDGAFVRRWLPELARVPTRYLHEPWTMPEAVQRESGCAIGRDYPAPIVDHARARALALAVYGGVRDEDQAVTAEGSGREEAGREDAV